MATGWVTVVAALLFISSAIGYNHLCVDEHWEAGVHPHPTECHKFVACSNGIAYEKTCPANLAFNAQAKVCDDPIKLNCYPGATTGPISVYSTPTMPTTKKIVILDHLCVDKHWKAGVHPHPTECHKFVECSNGIAYEMNCPADLAFNPEAHVCDDAVKLNCLTYVTHPPTRTSITDLSHYCQDKNLESGIHAHPLSCHKFIECSLSKTYIMDCPLGLVYDSRVKTCETASEAPPCKKTGGKTNIKEGTLCGKFNLSEGLYPHPIECNKFIECSKSKTLSMKCPAGLRYHSREEKCKDVYEVNCKDNLDFFKNLAIG